MTTDKQSKQNGNQLNTPEQTTEAPAEFGIQQIFVKDVSFETPHAHQLSASQKPDIDVELNAATSKLAEDVYQVQLSITVTATVQEKTAFLVEVKQVGTFTIKGCSDAQLHRMLGSYCPEILYPYARELISEMVTRGGFPPLYLAPVNFEALYNQQVQKQQNEARSAEPVANAEPADT